MKLDLEVYRYGNTEKKTPLLSSTSRNKIFSFRNWRTCKRLVSPEPHQAQSRASKAGVADESSTMTVSSLEDLREKVVDDMTGGVSIPLSSPFELCPGVPVLRPMVYCDFTASHRPLQSIEHYLNKHCLPSYGKTHTHSSLTGSQSYGLLRRSPSDRRRSLWSQDDRKW